MQICLYIYLFLNRVLDLTYSCFIYFILLESNLDQTYLFKYYKTYLINYKGRK